ncbi:MAG TPA: OsmC family protein [Candidatus Lustribacter sp.]|nr:OsmC family protein [Candidatus Lustribacter sp.]
MDRTMRVERLGGDRYSIDVRGHQLTVDQPESDGGEDLAPTPTELFVAGLASCVAFYAGRFLKRHDIPADGLAVDAAYEFASKPARVAEVTLTVHAPAGLPAERRDALLAVASHCTVHNTVMSEPEITVTLV